MTVQFQLGKHLKGFAQANKNKFILYRESDDLLLLHGIEHSIEKNKATRHSNIVDALGLKHWRVMGGGEYIYLPEEKRLEFNYYSREYGCVPYYIMEKFQDPMKEEFIRVGKPIDFVRSFMESERDGETKQKWRELGI